MKPVTGRNESGGDPERHVVTTINPRDHHRSQRLGRSAPVGLDRARLGVVMQAVAAGDGDAVFDLWNEFRQPIGGVVRAELRRHNVGWVDHTEFDGLVIDACLALADCAGGWHPDGALPWAWARHRIAAVVGRWVGQFADEFDPDRHEPDPIYLPQPWSGHEPAMLDALADLAAHNPVVALVRDALGQAGSRRDQELLVGYIVQQRAGDHSPAVTLGVMFDLSPEAVRKAVSRMRRRLRHMVATDPRFGVLEGLPLLE